MKSNDPAPLDTGKMPDFKEEYFHLAYNLKYSHDNLYNYWMLKLTKLREENERKDACLKKINEIRNGIVGLQSINWSEHIYPLVAALNEADVKGMQWPEARAYFGTMLERTVKSEATVKELQSRISELEKEKKELTALALDYRNQIEHRK